MKKIMFSLFFVMTSSYAMAQAIVTESTSNSTSNSKSETTVNSLLTIQSINEQYQ
jgi:hypothetical protein